MKTAWKHTSDAGTSSAAGYVAFIERSGRRELVAFSSSLYRTANKWNAAFQGKTYFCGDLDANPLPPPSVMIDSGLLVSVCSEARVRRHSSSVVDPEWKILVVDAGAARASDGGGMFEGEPL